MLSIEYNELFAQGIDEFSVNVIQQRGDAAYNDTFCLFYPLIGQEYEKEKGLLVVGQAVNGWQPTFTVDDVRTGLDEVMKKGIGYSREDGNKCPLEWVNEYWSDKEGYKTSSSFFWNISYKLIKAFYNKTDENWNNIMAWSNLMKMAPAEGGNPDTLLIEAQKHFSAKLFKKEIEDLKPKNVLVMTNLKAWAAPILEKGSISYETVNGDYVEAIAYYNNSKIIITKRGYLPAGMTHEKIITEVSSYLVK